MKTKRLMLAVAIALTAGANQADTWYKIGNDAKGKISWTGTCDSSIGWAGAEDATSADTGHTVSSANDYVVPAGRSLRTADGNVSFAGKTLTLSGTSENSMGDITLKSSSTGTRTITIPSLIIDGYGALIQGTDKTRFNMSAPTTINSGSTYRLSFTTSGSAADWRDIDLQSAVVGDATTKIDLAASGKATNTARCYLSGSFENFKGKIVSSTAGTDGARFYLYCTNTFGGFVESLPKSTALVEIDYAVLPAGKGLVCSSTTIPPALKDKLVFYSSGATDFGTDNLPLITFPNGTNLDPSEFTVRCRSSFILDADGTETSFGLKTINNVDGTVTLAVDASVPSFAKLVKGNDNSWSWHIYDNDMVDVTASCGLSEPSKDIKVLFETQEEFEALTNTVFTSSGVLWTLKQLSSNMDLRGFDFRIEDGATVDLNGFHLTLSGALMEATSATTTLTSTVAGGVLEINVPASEARTVEHVNIAGGVNLQVWKTGLGSLMMRRAQTFGGNGTVSFVVKEGPASKSNLEGNLFGAEYSKVEVLSGAQVDIRGRRSWKYDYVIAGDGPDGSGALINNAEVSNPAGSGESGYLRHIELANDATIGGTNVWALNYDRNGTHYLTFNGHTLTLAGPAKIYWINLVPQDAGRLIVSNTVEVYGANVDFGAVDVEVAGSLDSNAGNYLANVKSLVFEPDATWNGVGDPATASTVVYETYRPSTNAMPAVTLGASGHTTPVLDLSTQTGTLDGTNLSFGENATVTVQLGGRKVSGENKKLVSWTQKPAAVHFKLSAERAGSLAQKEDGLYLTYGTMIIVR